MFPAKEDTGGLLVPLVSFTGRAPCSHGVPLSARGLGFIRASAVGIRIRKMPAVFFRVLGREEKPRLRAEPTLDLVAASLSPRGRHFPFRHRAGASGRL